MDKIVDCAWCSKDLEQLTHPVDALLLVVLTADCRRAGDEEGDEDQGSGGIEQ